jgi:hypothetical protein
MPASLPTPWLSPRRAELAPFPMPMRSPSSAGRRGGCQLVIATGDPIQPYRTVSDEPANDEHVLACVA